MNSLSSSSLSMSDMASLMTLIAVALVAVFLVLWTRRAVRRKPPVAPPPAVDHRQTVLIDGSNVIYWLDNTPQLAPLLQVVHDLSRQGLKPGVVFDANVGYKLTGKFMGERDLSRMLSLPKDQIVTNDRFRDWVDHYPDVARPERLVRGSIRDGRVWLPDLEAKEKAKNGAL
jgi:hypothetical protein